MGTLLILVLSFRIWKKDFLKITGLKINLRILLTTILTLGLVILVSGLFVFLSEGSEGLLFSIGNWRSYFHQVFYIVNEEIVLGSLPIYFLMKRLNLNKWVTACGIAILFSILHFIFYLLVFDQRGLLQLSTLITLFLVGFFRNALIISNGHIGYSWALHFGWMSVMFGSFPMYTDGTPLREPDNFNLFLGSWIMVIIALILVLLYTPFFRTHEIFSGREQSS